MTAVLIAGADQRTARMTGLRGWGVAIALVAGLFAIVIARALAIRAGFEPLTVGVAFGIALAAVAFAGRQAPVVVSLTPVAARRTAVSITLGIVVGLALVGLVVFGAAIASQPLIPGLSRSAAPFAPWAAVTILVAAAEEAVLRGRLFASVKRSAGIVAAIVITAVAFALMHVPIYGWHVVPLDLAVGVVFGGLRVATRSVSAPAAAHAVADLATWWL